MARPNQTTLTAVTAPTVLTIGCAPDLRERCASALGPNKMLLKHSDLAQAPTIAAERRPLVLVVPEGLYEFDPCEFDALARDVGASLLRVDDDMPAELLEMLLGAAIDAAISRRHNQGARLADIDDPNAGPQSWRKTAPVRIAFADRDAPPSSSGASGA